MCQGNQARYRKGTLWLDEATGDTYRLRHYAPDWTADEPTDHLIPSYRRQTLLGTSNDVDTLPAGVKVLWWPTKEADDARRAANREAFPVEHSFTINPADLAPKEA